MGPLVASSSSCFKGTPRGDRAPHIESLSLLSVTAALRTGIGCCCCCFLVLGRRTKPQRTNGHAFFDKTGDRENLNLGRFGNVMFPCSSLFPFCRYVFFFAHIVSSRKARAAGSEQRAARGGETQNETDKMYGDRFIYCTVVDITQADAVLL